MDKLQWICELCGNPFDSIEWYKEDINMNNMPICDDCLLKILEARRDTMKNEVTNLEQKIELLKLKNQNK